MTVAVRIGHCNETVPKNLIISVTDAYGGSVTVFPIGPGIERVVNIHSGQTITITEQDTIPLEDGEE